MIHVICCQSVPVTSSRLVYTSSFKRPVKEPDQNARGSYPYLHSASSRITNPMLALIQRPTVSGMCWQLLRIDSAVEGTDVGSLAYHHNNATNAQQYPNCQDTLAGASNNMASLHSVSNTEHLPKFSFIDEGTEYSEVTTTSFSAALIC